MSQSPLPYPIPGEFFVLLFDRDVRSYTLFVDDAAHSSYNLGDDIQSIMAYFRMLGLIDLGNSAIDLAREFGASQVVPSENRVFRVDSQPQRGTPEFKFEDATEAGVFLPSL